MSRVRNEKLYFAWHHVLDKRYERLRKMFWYGIAELVAAAAAIVAWPLMMFLRPSAYWSILIVVAFVIMFQFKRTTSKWYDEEVRKFRLVARHCNSLHEKLTGRRRSQ